MANCKEMALLESGVLELEDAQLDWGCRYYPRALRTQAVSLVDFLTQIKDAGVERKNPIVATYHSVNTTLNLVLTDNWNFNLAAAVSDLGYAVGLRIQVDSFKGGEVSYPEYLKSALEEDLQLPPALQHRIDGRRAVIDQELAEQIQVVKLRSERLSGGSFRRTIPIIGNIQQYLEDRKERKTCEARTAKLQSGQPDFQLAIGSGYDTKSNYGFDYQRGKWFYQRLIHEVFLVESR
ncbi:hypothetical protein M1437_03110 [Patescibacteria group bacterium]|nr:hypothetical protein [Patescibacteria group bacterium]